MRRTASAFQSTGTGTTRTGITTPTPPRSLRSHPISGTVRLMDFVYDLFGLGDRTAGPILDLFIHLWLAQTFWVSGIIKLSDWDKALYLATNEYPVSWMNPVLAAVLGVAIEVLGPIFLVLGLGTRLAALAMLILTLVIQYAYMAVPEQEFWAILFGWYVVMGAGTFSLDRLLAVSGTAFPFADRIEALGRAITRYAGPIYMLFIRFWIARIFFLSGLTKIEDIDKTIILFDFEY